jgi:hypothetical protein
MSNQGVGTNSSTYTLTGTTLTISTQAKTMSIPMSITLDSTAGGRAIQLSTDGGVDFFAAVTPTLTMTSEIMYYCTYPITHIKVTGVANDTVTLVY